MGDFNMDLLCESIDHNIQNFSLSLREHAFFPIITKPTRVVKNSVSLLDHMWVNFHQKQGFHSSVIRSVITDHFPTMFYYELESVCETHKVITFRRSGQISDEIFKDRLTNSNLYEILLIQDVNLAFSKFNSTVYNIYDEAYPMLTKTVKYNSVKNPWITSGIKESIKTKNKIDSGTK